MRVKYIVIDGLHHPALGTCNKRTQLQREHYRGQRSVGVLMSADWSCDCRLSGEGRNSVGWMKSENYYSREHPERATSDTMPSKVLKSVWTTIGWKLARIDYTPPNWYSPSALLEQRIWGPGSRFHSARWRRKSALEPTNVMRWGTPRKLSLKISTLVTLPVLRSVNIVALKSFQHTR